MRELSSVFRMYNGGEAHPHKQVHEHAEDDVARLAELLWNLAALEGQQEAAERQQCDVAQHDTKADFAALATLDQL